MYPSIIAHTFSGAFLIFAFIYLIINFTKIQNFDIYRMLIVILLFSIVLGIHGLSHLLLEKEYKYTPLDIWKIPQENKEGMGYPIRRRGVCPHMRRGECPYMRRGECPFMKQISE